MPKVDLEWAADQLARAGYDARDARRQAIGNSVRILLQKLNEQNRTAEDRNLVVELFAHLASGRDVAPRLVQGEDARWTQFRLGDVRPGATVRVHVEAYTGIAGEVHNGMVGRVVGARNGEVIVQYAGSSEGTGYRHPPAALEVLVGSDA